MAHVCQVSNRSRFTFSDTFRPPPKSSSLGTQVAMDMLITMVKSVPIHIHKRDLQRSTKVRGQVRWHPPKTKSIKICTQVLFWTLITMLKSIPIHIHKLDLQRSAGHSQHHIHIQRHIRTPPPPSKIDRNWRKDTLLDADYYGEVLSDSHS